MTEAYPPPIDSTVEVSYPRRMGRPRSFWVILGLGIITFGIYFIVYHYLVALELKNSMRWSDDDRYSPTSFLWFYTAYILFSLAPVSVIMFVMLASLPEIIAAGSEFTVETLPGLVAIQDMLTVYAIFTTALGFYITFYFLRLNDWAAGKIHARRLGTTVPLAAFAVFYTFNLISDIAKAIFGAANVNVDKLGNFSGASFLALIGLGFLALFFSMVVLGLLFYAYWRQTELVNHVWLAGDFGDRPAAPQAPIPTQAPSTQAPYSPPTPPPAAPPPPETPT